MKFKERPTERDHQKGGRQNRYEHGRSKDEHGREEINLPRPAKSGAIVNMCVDCGRAFATTKKDNITCPSCSNPAVGL